MDPIHDEPEYRIIPDLLPDNEAGTLFCSPVEKVQWDTSMKARKPGNRKLMESHRLRRLREKGNANRLFKKRADILTLFPNPDLEKAVTGNVDPGTGTFFVTGKFIETNKEGILKITKAGHEVANHSYEHDRKNSISECDRVARLYREATEKEMSCYFRAPYPYEEKISWPDYAKEGWQEGYVSLITCDALPKFKRISDKTFLKNFRHYVKNGANERVAIHKTPMQKGPGHINGSVLETMIKSVRDKGYTIVPQSKLKMKRL